MTDASEYREADDANRGKTLGGSSSINGGTWTRGVKAQYDAFTTLLEPEDADKGWDWEGLFHYMKKVPMYVTIDPFSRILMGLKGRTFLAS